MNSCGFSFNLLNPYAQRALLSSTQEIAKGLAEGSDAVIREILSDTLAGKYTPDKAASLIQQSLGLTDRQARSVLKLHNRLRGASPGDLVWMGKKKVRIPRDGFPDSHVKTLLDRYSATLLRKRARTIAHTQTMFASNEGQVLAWKQLVKQEILPAGIQREWVITEDELACPICSALSGRRCGLDELFDGQFSGPPAHPDCRCTQILVVDEMEAWAA